MKKKRIKKSRSDQIAKDAGKLLLKYRKDCEHDFHYILTILTPKDVDNPNTEAEAVTVSTIHNIKLVQQTMREVSEGEVSDV